MRASRDRFHVVRDTLGDLHEQAGSSASAAAERIEDAATDLAEIARSATERLEEWSRDGFSSARNAVKDAPVMWSAISLVLVAVVGVAATWLRTRERARPARRRRSSAELRAKGSRAKAVRSAKRPTNSARSQPAESTE